MISFDAVGAEMIPVRLIISVVIVAVIAVLVGVGGSVVRTSLGEQQVEQQCGAVLSAVCTMVQGGAARDLDDPCAVEGTTRVVELRLPDSLVFLAFGGDPDVGGTGVLQSGLIEDGAVIFFRVQGGSTQVIWLDAGRYRFREGCLVGDLWTVNGGGCCYIIEGGGAVTLEFELVQRNQVNYVLVHGTDRFG